MKLLGIRFCSVSEQANEDIEFFNQGLGLTNSFDSNDDFTGGVFSCEDNSSWLEVWQQSEQMPAGIMLQLVVDNADEFAEHAKSKGIEPHGPMDAHGERIYYLHSPSGLNLSFQSKL